jgi:hypothetical protein
LLYNDKTGFLNPIYPGKGRKIIEKKANIWEVSNGENT